MKKFIIILLFSFIVVSCGKDINTEENGSSEPLSIPENTEPNF